MKSSEPSIFNRLRSTNIKIILFSHTHTGKTIARLSPGIMTRSLQVRVSWSEIHVDVSFKNLFNFTYNIKNTGKIYFFYLFGSRYTEAWYTKIILKLDLWLVEANTNEFSNFIHVLFSELYCLTFYRFLLELILIWYWTNISNKFAGSVSAKFQICNNTRIEKTMNNRQSLPTSG